jgi:hypothetical protein
MALGPTKKDKNTLGSQSKDLPTFGAGTQDDQPKFMDGRLVRQHGEAGDAIGFESSDKSQPLAKKTPDMLVDPKAITKRQKRKKADLVKKLPPVSDTKTMRSLRKSKMAPTHMTGWDWVVATIVGIGASIAMVFMYIGYFIAFIFMFFSQFVFNILYSILNLFFGIIGAILKGILPRLSSYGLYVGIVFITGYMFMQLNPAWFGKMKTFASRTATKIERATGFPVPTLPDVDLFFNPQKTVDRLGRASKSASRAMQDMGMPDIDIPDVKIPDFNFTSSSSLSNAFSGHNLPKELDSFASVPQTPETLNYFKRLYNSGYLGNKAEGAVPLLKNALNSSDAKVSAAAKKSLMQINSPAARRALQKSEFKAKKVIRGTTLRR